MKKEYVSFQVWHEDNCSLNKKYCKVWSAISYVTLNKLTNCEHFDEDTEECQYEKPKKLMKCPVCLEVHDENYFGSEGWCNDCGISGEGRKWKDNII